MWKQILQSLVLWPKKVWNINHSTITSHTQTHTHLSSSVIHRLSSLPFCRTGNRDTSLPCFRELGLVVMVLTLVTWRENERSSEWASELGGKLMWPQDTVGRRLQRTHPGLSADLQAVLQGQLVVLGGDDRPVEGARDLQTLTTTAAAGGVSELKYLRWEVTCSWLGCFPRSSELCGRDWR